MPEPDGAEFSVAGFKLGGAPKWAAGSAVLVAACVWAYLSIWQPSLAALTAEQARANVQASLDEYGRLMALQPEATCGLLDDLRGKITAARYINNSILLVRSGPGMVPRSKVILDLARDEDRAPKSIAEFLIAPVAAASIYTSAPVPPDGAGIYTPVRGNCRAVNAHECLLRPNGACFDSWYGLRNGCMVQVWRQWSDGCKQVQWLDTCHGVLVGDPTWTNCVH